MYSKKYLAPIGLLCSLTAMSLCATPPGEGPIASSSAAVQIQSNLVASPGADDSLYISDSGDNNIKRFNSRTGAYLGKFAIPTPEPMGLPTFPTGLVFTQLPSSRCQPWLQMLAAGAAGAEPPCSLWAQASDLLVNFQNQGTPFKGEVILFDAKIGEEKRQLVPYTDFNAPFDPRGVILLGNEAIIADFGNAPAAGQLSAYDKDSGRFLYAFDTTGYSTTTLFQPRGLVLGPDGLLYVSVMSTDRQTGAVVRFDVRTHKYQDTFISSDTCNCVFHRPEGLVFGPDGDLYVTSFQGTDPNDTDRIDVFSGRTGAYRRAIPTYEVGQARAYAQAILFGSDGYLFVPITGNGVAGGGGASGEVRRYNPMSGKYTVLVPATAQGGPLLEPSFLTFGNTDPTTLNYPPNGNNARQ